MQEKMVRFLSTLLINNIDDFDLDFEMIGKDRFDPNRWNMIIKKDNPWSYELLKEFMDGLVNIKFSYLLRFTYVNKPTNDDVRTLLDDWHKSIYHIPNDLNLSFNNEGVIYINYSSKEDKDKHSNVVKDFKDFLSFICYDFVISEKIVEQVKASKTSIVIEKEGVTTNNQEIKEDIHEVNQEIGTSNNTDILAAIEDEHKKEIEIVEDALLKQMKENAILMAKERERARLNKRGNYEVIDLIDSITTNSQNVDVCGKCFFKEVNEYGTRKRVKFTIVDDNGGAIYVVAYGNANFNDEVIDHLDKSNVRVRGAVYVDEYSKQLTIKAHYVDLLPPDEILPEENEEKRVELHLHTNMSTQDAVTSAEDYIKYALALGHKAIAITDHGCIQAYPDAIKVWKKNKDKIKILYGCEFFMIDDELSIIKNPSEEILNKANYVVLDLETTGLSARYERIIEFGAVKVEHGLVTSHFDMLINPEKHIPDKITAITNINDDMVKDAPTIKEALPKIFEYIKGCILVTHNADFDFSFLQEEAYRLGYGEITNSVIDTLAISRYLFPEHRNHRLGTVCRNFEVKYDEESAHRADYDAEVLNNVWLPMLAMITKDNLNLRHKDLNDLQAPKELIRHIRPYHVIALIKNEQGIKDMNILVSKCNVDYLADVPKIPRRELDKYRSNLLLGSACFNGEVFKTAQYYNEERLKKVISYYDYIEVQPPENYSFLVNMGDLEEEDVHQYINDIYNASKTLNKTVVATGDVHYLTKKEKCFRDVFISAMGVGNIPHPLNPFNRNKKKPFDNPDQHYRTTNEMLEAFSFMGEDKAKEIVITNTNLIADSIDTINPVPNNVLYTPQIDNVENLLTDMCFSKAKELYGDPLPIEIEKRLQTELNGIISNGYAVIYYIAHKIVKKSNDDGYIVGSRGSVGSSFAATMSGITEVNALAPHYRCPKCKHMEWSKDEYPEIKSGYDLPEKKCPICGTDMVHDGQNIPFETFLGFNADKTPDIDLNFPRDYQSTAHEYTKVLLGENNVFRAGTIETVKDKTAFGFAKGYLERCYMQEGYSKSEAQDKANQYPKAKLDYLASGCIGVKRTTGQHPGGIVVIPDGHEVFDFTPVQYPADEPNSAWRTTHLDYDAIHDTVLKLDMLGHLDPMALKMMCDITGVPVENIPMNDPKVLSLFSSNEALNIKKDYLKQKTGAMAIPEFGTDFVRGILESTSPKTFNDLVIISGLSHGTNVWNDNADKLIESGTATLQEVIGCRDDIMTYLISKGINPSDAFSIMEDVRHGKKLKDTQVEIMRNNQVPEFYINSCNLIKYLFPKGHAVAYVTMAVRVGYFKVYYPLEFYATFFSIRSKQFDIKPMIKGEESVIERLEELKLKSHTKGEKLSPKEEEQIKTLNIAIEMLQRGYKFSNIDLYKSDAINFVVDKENKALIPPFITIDGLGENNAITIIEARKEKPFSSIEDISRRTKISYTNLKDLEELGALNGLDKDDQLSLF